MFDAEIDWMCRKEEGGAPGWLSAFWSVQMAGWECCPPKHETRKTEAGAWLGEGGGEEMVCSVWGMMSLRCYWDIPVEISNKSSA